jgi:hypothetical protein
LNFTADRLRNVNEDLELHGEYRFNRLSIGAGLSFARLSGISRDVGAEATRSILTASGLIAYSYSPKTKMSVELSVPVRQFSGQTDSTGLTVTPALDYQYSPRTSFGLEIAAGTLHVQGGKDQVFERPSFRMSYSLNERIVLRGSLGLEHRDGSDSSMNTPVFELDASWLLREGTQISLSAERRVSASAVEAGSNFTSTIIQLSLLQRIGSRFRGSLTAGYEDAVYEGESVEINADRHDKLLTGQASLAYILTSHVSIILTGAAVDNRSNQRAFRDYQGSLQSSIAF